MRTLPGMLWLATQQDYLWFLSALAWSAAWLAWRREGRGDRALRWLPWSALAGLVTAGLELSLLAIPIDSVPYAVPRIGWDLALGGAGALQLIGWCWSALETPRPGWRLALVGLAAIAAARLATLRAEWTFPASLALALLSTVALAAHARSGRGQPAVLAALGANVLAVWTASYGPLAGWAGSPRAFTDLSLLGPWAAFTQLAAAIIVTAILARRALHRSVVEIKRELRSVFIWLAIWLAGGLLLASVASALARQLFAQSAIGRVRASAALVNTEALAQALGPRLRLGAIRRDIEATGQVFVSIEITGLPENALDPVREALGRIKRANPDIEWARVDTLRGDHLLLLCDSTGIARYRDANAISPATGADRLEWAERQATFSDPLALNHGEYVRARAPLEAPGGRMLGWLAFEFSMSRWIAVQAQSRLLAFAITALGCGLVVLLWSQRLSQRAREAAQSAAAVAHEADRTKTAFLAKVSHELRTPVQSILGYGELLAAVPLEPEARRWLGAVRAQGQLLVRLVNDLIDLSALQTGAFRLAPRADNLSELVRGVVESLAPRARAKGLALDCELDPRLPHWLVFDAERVRQVVLNLVGNAVKFTARGEVRVRLRGSAPGGAEPAATTDIELDVQDTGPGIAPLDQPRLFRPFSRLENTAAIEGAGLGLALAATLCRSMGGELRVASDGVHGSTFTARWRFSQDTAPEPDAGVPPAVQLAGRLVLVADDNPLVRELFLSVLRAAGAWCESATDGLEAVERCARERFDVVVLDVSMPWLDGFEATRRLRAVSPTSLRIVGVSAHAGGNDHATAHAAGMDAFLVKPVAAADLLAAVAGGTEPVPVATAATTAADLALLRRLREGFQEELERIRAELAQAVRDDDRRWLRARAHYLKNGADVAGYPEVSLLCAQLETALAGPHSTATTSATLHALVAEIDRTLGQLAAAPPPAP